MKSKPELSFQLIILLILIFNPVCKPAEYFHQNLDRNLKLSNLEQSIPEWAYNSAKAGKWTKSASRRKQNSRFQMNLMSPSPPCDGYQNFIHDVELISLELMTAGFFKGSFAWFFNVTAQSLRLLIKYIDNNINNILPESAEILNLVHLIQNILSLPYGNVTVAIDFIGQCFGFLSLCLDTFTIFNDTFHEIIMQVLHIDLKSEFQRYGC